MSFYILNILYNDIKKTITNNKNKSNIHNYKKCCFIKKSFYTFNLFEF